MTDPAILELDIGNSRAKWRLLQEGGPVGGVVHELTGLQAALSGLARPAAVRYCSVSDSARFAGFDSWCEESLGLTPSRALVQRELAGVRVQYADPGRLGVDRWLTLLSGYARAGGACVIVDAGTAVTVDLLDESGLHLGGYILPGLHLMRDALTRNTRIRLQTERVEFATAPGNSTDAAVNNGALAALAALVQQVMAGFESRPALYFSGGDGELLAGACGQWEAEQVPSLVLDGLALACPL